MSASASKARPFVIPMAYARVGDTVYLHGATGNRMLRHLADGAEVCVSVTLLDALGPGPLGLPSLDELPLRHAVRHRSGGRRRRREASGHRWRCSSTSGAGRSDDTRLPTPEELRATRMVRMPIEEGSAKVRTGGPIDEPEDMGASASGPVRCRCGGGRSRHPRRWSAARRRHSRLRRRLSRPGRTGVPSGRRVGPRRWWWSPGVTGAVSSPARARSDRAEGDVC